MDYDIKRGHFRNIEGDGLKNIMEELFNGCREDGDTLIASYGGMKELKVRILDKSTVSIETESDPGVPDDVALDTIRKFNGFLEKATGFTSKQRRDRLSKKAKEGKL